MLQRAQTIIQNAVADMVFLYIIYDALALVVGQLYVGYPRLALLHRQLQGLGYLPDYLFQLGRNLWLATAFTLLSL